MKNDLSGFIFTIDVCREIKAQPMHVLYIHQYFATPSGSTGTRSYEFARRWVAKGHKVTILTSTAQLSPSDLSGAKGRLVKRCRIDGIHIIALSVPYRQQMGALKRCLSFFGFLVCASIVVLFIKKIDVVYATSTPLTVGIPALAVKWLRNKNFIFEVRDQWPESIVQLGLLRNKFLIVVLLFFEKLIYKNADAIITFSDGMADGVRQVAEQKKPVYVVSNGADLDLFRPDIDGSGVRERNGWDNKLVLLQAGAMGLVNGLEFVIEVATKLRNYEDVLFVLIGDGSHKKSLMEKVAERMLTNVEFLPPVTKQELPEFFAAADIIMVVMANFEIFEKVAALNKFYDGLSVGKPILLNYSGWHRKLVEGYKAGYGCRLWDIDDFAEKVLYFRSHRRILANMGRNSRKLAEERFDREKLASEALSRIESILKE